jgi:hypothetical protein
MICDPKYNVNKEAKDYLLILYETLDWLDNISIALEKGKSITDTLFPRFNPLKTIGKYGQY